MEYKNDMIPAMNITKENAQRLCDIVQEIKGQLEEFKTICRRAMSENEYQLFKYRTLGHVEPGLADSDWLNQGELDTLEDVAENALAEAEEGLEPCDECGETLGHDGHCHNHDCVRCMSERS